VYEQGIAALRDPRLRWSIVGRAVAGIPADLLWRRAVRRAADREQGIGIADRWERGGSVLVAGALGVTLLIWGLFVLVRIAIGAARGAWLPGDDIGMIVAAAVVADVCGLVLLARRTTRWVGALWLAAASYALIRYGTKALAYMSATAFTVFTNSPVADRANQLLVVFVCLFFSANALLWFETLPMRLRQDHQLQGERS
jgi:hypothetical protein